MVNHGAIDDPLFLWISSGVSIAVVAAKLDSQTAESVATQETDPHIGYINCALSFAYLIFADGFDGIWKWWTIFSSSSTFFWPPSHGFVWRLSLKLSLITSTWTMTKIWVTRWTPNWPGQVLTFFTVQRWVRHEIFSSFSFSAPVFRQFPSYNQFYPLTSSKVYSLGFVDPIVVVAVIALPLLALLALGSLMMPLVPIILYLLTIFFPVTTSGRKKRDATAFPVFSSRFLLDSLSRFEKASAKNI